MNRSAAVLALCLIAACGDSVGPTGGVTVETVGSDGQAVGVPLVYWYSGTPGATVHPGQCNGALCSRWTFTDQPAGDVVIASAWLGLHPVITGCEWGGQGAIPVRVSEGESRVVRLRVEITWLCPQPALPAP